MSDEDFYKSMLDDDVVPMQQEKRVSLNKDKDSDVDKQQRRVAAEQQEEKVADPLSTLPSEILDPFDVLSFKRPGVQNGVFRNLRLGKYQIDARLDMHRMIVDEARKSLYQFVLECIENDVRCALITHGKSEGRETPAMLKSCVAHWLPELDEVLAFHTAQKHHGSYGATYVLLKKSDSKRQKTREINSKR